MSTETVIPAPETTARKSFPTKTISVDMVARTVRHFVTTPTMDEDGEVLLPRGADISRFTKSPTVFDVHQYGSKNVLGTCISYEISDEGHIAVTKFASRPASLPAEQEWLPDTILHLINEGDIKGWSIGFQMLEARQPTAKDLSDYGGDLVRVITRYRVLEYSVAPLPCNGDALTLSMKGLLSKSLADRLAKGEPAIVKVTSQIITTIPTPQRKIYVIGTAPKSAPAPTIEAMTTRAVRFLRGELYEND
jgi:hypothetical protein